MYKRSGGLGAVLVALGCAFGAQSAVADVAGVRDYDVTITNLTRGQLLSPPIVATHQRTGKLWRAGRAVSFGVKEVAENGNNGPLLHTLRQQRISDSVFDYVQAISAPMLPGPLVPKGRPGAGTFPDGVSFAIRASKRHNRLSFVSMLVCTNDGITGVDSMRLPSRKGKAVTVRTNALEIQTERNTEVLADIMPPCQQLIGVRSPSGAPGTTQSNPQLAETGVIIPHPGIAGGSDLDPAVHGWSNPVAKIVVKRVG